MTHTRTASLIETIEPRLLLAAPDDLAGWTFRTNVTNGTGVYAGGGGYDIAFASGSDDRYTIDGFSGIPDSNGAYAYTRFGSDRGELELFDSLTGRSDVTFIFTSDDNGNYSATADAGGFSTGTFTVLDRPADNTPPTSPSPIISNELGDRVAVIGSSLFVSADDTSDVMTVTRVGDELRVSLNGLTARVRADAVGVLELAGRGGNDAITVGSGVPAARVSGGPGNDQLFGGDNGDELHGNEGNDYIFGGGSGDLLRGNDGKDTLSGGGGPNTLFGGAGEDRLNGSGSRDLLYGEEDDDRLYGFGGNDTLDGGGGVDRLFGDELGTAGGDDLLIGGGSNDKLYARGGNDTLIGNRGRDLFAGGDGFDTAIFDADDDTGNPDLVSGIEASA